MKLPRDARGNRLCLNSPHTWPDSMRKKSKEPDQGGERDEGGVKEERRGEKEEEGSGKHEYF